MFSSSSTQLDFTSVSTIISPTVKNKPQTCVCVSFEHLNFTHYLHFQTIPWSKFHLHLIIQIYFSIFLKKLSQWWLLYPTQKPCATWTFRLFREEENACQLMGIHDWKLEAQPYKYNMVLWVSRLNIVNNIQDVKRIVVFITCMSTLLDSFALLASNFSSITIIFSDSRSDFKMIG